MYNNVFSASEAYLCGGNSLCFKEDADSSFLKSLGIELCQSDNISKTTCRKNGKFTSTDDQTCDIENDKSCAPLTVSNVRTYLGDVCISESESSPMILLHCSTG